MVHHSPLPLAGCDGDEPLAQGPVTRDDDARSVLIRIAPFLKYRALQFAGNDRELRRDLFQEASVAVISAVDEYQYGVGQLDGYASARGVKRMWTVCRQHRRRHKRISYRDPHPSATEPGFDPVDPSTEKCNACALDRARVRDLIPMVLTQREQQVVGARYYGDLTTSETAKRLRLSKGRIAQLESSALAKLRVAFEQPSISLN